MYQVGSSAIVWSECIIANNDVLDYMCAGFMFLFFVFVFLFVYIEVDQWEVQAGRRDPYMIFLQ